MKKVIKIILMVLIIGIILFIITGCGKEKEVIVENTIIEEELSKTEENSEEESLLGNWNNDTYENENLGLKFNLPEEWVYSTEEDVVKMMNIDTEYLEDEKEFLEEMSKLNTAYYMVANNPNTGDSVTILTEKLAKEVTEEKFLNQLKNDLEYNMSYNVGEVLKEKISGIEFKTLTITTSNEVTQKYYVCKKDEHFVCIIATSTSGENNINTIMKAFK